MKNRQKLVYLAGPVRMLGRTAAIDIRRRLEIYCLRRGMVSFNPPGAFCGDTSDECEATVKRCNDTILSLSDMMAAIFISGVESSGTDAEMRLAAALLMPIIVVCLNRDDISNAIAWANPLMADVEHKGIIAVEFAVLNGNTLDSVTTINYERAPEVTIG